MKSSSIEETQTSKNKQGNWWLVLSVITLIVAPLIFVKGEYSGADGQAHDAIVEIKPDYQPWLETIIEPPSAEVESFLFATQAALGAGVIGYTIGFYKGRKQTSEDSESNIHKS